MMDICGGKGVLRISSLNLLRCFGREGFGAEVQCSTNDIVWFVSVYEKQDHGVAGA